MVDCWLRMLAAGFDERPNSWLSNGRSWYLCMCGQLADESAQCARNRVTTALVYCLQSLVCGWTVCLQSLRDP